MSSVQLKYRDGRLCYVTMYDPDSISVSDCRDSDCRPFISVSGNDDQGGLSMHLPPELAHELYIKLSELFDEQAPVMDQIGKTR